jgi:putative acetyltransferase
MTDKTLVCVEADPCGPEATELMAALDQEVLEIYPDLPIHGIDPVEFRRVGGVFLIGQLDRIPVACGALRPLGDHMGEVKRMFVRRAYRRNGFSKIVLATLEEIACGRGYRTMRLETGVNQPAAIALYECAGYQRIPCYGEFVGDPRSRCFEKQLEAAQSSTPQISRGRIIPLP